MFNSFLSLAPKTKVLILTLVGIIILTTIIIALQTPPQNETIPAEQTQIIPSQTPIIGKKITPEIEKKLNIIKKEATSEGKIIYYLNSQNPIRTDQIITQNQQIIFQRYYIPENPSDPNHILISRMIEKYGTAEKIIRASKLWGPHMQTYIYNSKGLAFIGNPNTDEVYELQTFAPIPLEEYLQKYGDDIDSTPPGPES